MASPPRKQPLELVELGAPLAVLGSSQWVEANRVGSWTWLIARCWWPSWIQRALQLVQMAIGYRPKVMVTRADRHNGQRGMTTSDLSDCLLVAVGWRHGRAPGARLESVLKAEVAGRAGLGGCW